MVYYCWMNSSIFNINHKLLGAEQYGHKSKR